MKNTSNDENRLTVEGTDAARPEKAVDVEKEGSKNKGMTVARQAVVSPTQTKRRNALLVILLVAAVVVVVLAVTLTLRNREDTNKEDVPPPPAAVDFTTGVSLVTYYGVNATITSRLSSSILTLEVTNGLDCTSIHGITLQLPMAARIASLKTMSDDGCETHGKAQSLREARETFMETASQGLPGAYVEERNSFTYSLQVALPPLGTTRVELVLEELLRHRVGEVRFQIPFTPNEDVDQVRLEVTILDANVTQVLPPANDSSTVAPVPTNMSLEANATTNDSNGTIFNLDLSIGRNVSVTATNKYKLDILNAREYDDLPKVISGYYNPGRLPENGALFTDGPCFEHLFLPSSVEPMSKNLFLLLDVSSGGEKLREVRAAVTNFIDSLTPSDTLTIQAFGERGTEDLWGSAAATDSKKTAAKRFVNSLEPRYEGTNLHEAYLEGLLRAKRDADESGVATVLVVISNSWPEVGETDRAKIASDVWKLNQEGKVKMFSLGFHDADLKLLSAIAIMNGGVALQIVEGNVDYASQIEHFFASEFGDILLSDVHVDFPGDVQVYGETQRVFPLLADGTEIAVRGLLSNHSSSDLRAVTTAMTKDGEETWTATAIQDPFVSTTGLSNSRCFQSYAHSRVTQLMHLRDAAELLGDETVAPVVFLARPCTETSLADCIEQEALSLALEANIAVKGLTGLVTIDDEQCQTFEGETEICLDGTASDGYGPEYPTEADDVDGYPLQPEAGWESTSGATDFHVSLLLSLILVYAWLKIDLLH